MKIVYEQDKATKFSARFHGNVEEYAMMWLNLTNNMRVHKELLKLTNNSENDIYIVCEEGTEKNTRSYLERLGLEILSEDTVTIIMPYANYEADEEYDWELLAIAEC